jgi:hypothetical protein
MLSHLKGPLVTLGFAILLLFIPLGEIIYNYFPCEQAPGNSMPCFGVYDIYKIGFAFILGLLSLIVMGVRVWRGRR